VRWTLLKLPPGSRVPLHCTAALKNVSVVLFPDNDEPGISAMHEVAKRLISEEITDKISWIHYNDKSFPDKWDIADPIPSGHTVESIFSKIIKFIFHFFKPKKRSFGSIQAVLVSLISLNSFIYLLLSTLAICVNDVSLFVSYVTFLTLISIEFYFLRGSTSFLIDDCLRFVFVFE